ncbi:VOC family protein [Paenibacillus turpanensis]|uniref:VOC family protein n=1 Tax=Paenibacillus turpanensis TaxID=2689078 RepID=UPI00140E7BFE|nr:VOC family protein [Paenibacillus turpanensis]
MTFKPSKTFINLPVKDLKKTMDFFSEIGFGFNFHFTDEKAACMIINDHTYAMLLVESYFQTFIDKELADTAKSAEVLIALTAHSREQVDAVVKKALAAGGSHAKAPQDHGFMYSWSFQDVNGHIWELFYMDENAVPQDE